MKRLKKKLKKTEAGQALVEFAICLPLLLTILCGIFDFGWVYMNEYEVNHASYEAARYAALHANDDGITRSTLENNMKALVEQNLSHKDSSLNISFTWPDTVGIGTITVRQPVHMLTYVGMTFFGRTYPIVIQNAFYTYASA